MFVTEGRLKKVIGELLGVEAAGDSKVSVLKEKVASLKVEIGDLQLKKTLEEKEIKHLVKMKEEKMDIEATKKELEMQKTYQTKEMDLMREYHVDILAQITKAEDKFQDIYKSILERLPNVNVEMKGKV